MVVNQSGRQSSLRARGYSEIADDLRERINTGEYLPGALLPTERELQDVFRASRGTVRRALHALVEAGWAESSPNRGVVAKSGPRQRRSSIVGFIDHTSSVHQYLFFTLGRILRRHGLHLVHADSQERGTEGALEYCLEHDFCAAVAWSKTGTPIADRVIKVQSEMPIVAVDHSLRNIPTDVVMSDVFAGSCEAVRHLAGLGRKRIAISGMLDSLDTTNERLGGYLAGIFESGMSPQAKDFVFCCTSSMKAPDCHHLDVRLREADRPDAIFVMQDTYVPWVLDSIREAGLDCPKDVAVVGIGNELPIVVGQCGLTTVSLDWDLVAHELAHRIISKLENPGVPVARFFLPTRLIVRGSCGAPPEQWMEDPYEECGINPRMLLGPGLNPSTYLPYRNHRDSYSPLRKVAEVSNEEPSVHTY